MRYDGVSAPPPHDRDVPTAGAVIPGEDTSFLSRLDAVLNAAEEDAAFDALTGVGTEQPDGTQPEGQERHETLRERTARQFTWLLGQIEQRDAKIAALEQEKAELAAKNAQLESHNEQLKDKLMIDELTEVGTVRALNARRAALQRLLRGGGRRSGEKNVVAVGVVSMDVIDMKGANSISQEYGDTVLRRAAAHMRSHFRTDDIFRRGGDEFVILVALHSREEQQAFEAEVRLMALEKQGQQLRVGFALAEAAKGDEAPSSITEAELLADPKTHRESRIRRHAAEPFEA